MNSFGMFIKKRLLLLTLILIFICLFFLVYKIYVQPVAVVVPHHNIVSNIRLKMLQKVKLQRPFTKKIIVLSPDHFSSDQKSIYFSDSNWEFVNTKLFFDQKNNLTINLKKENALVKNDHGIYNVLSDISKVWGNEVKVTPILIGQKVEFENLIGFIKDLNEYCKIDCLLIASVDFSHYLPYKLANVHDQESLESLYNLRLDNLKQIEVDSPQSIKVLEEFSRLKNARVFKLYNNTNSAEIYANDFAESTSHIFGWYKRSTWGKTTVYKVNTFTYANGIEEEKNLNSLGERFFYGVDDINLNINSINEDSIMAGYENDSRKVTLKVPVICKSDVCFFDKSGNNRIDEEIITKN